MLLFKYGYKWCSMTGREEINMSHSQQFLSWVTLCWKTSSRCLAHTRAGLGCIQMLIRPMMRQWGQWLEMMSLIRYCKHVGKRSDLARLCLTLSPWKNWLKNVNKEVEKSFAMYPFWWSTYRISCFFDETLWCALLKAFGSWWNCK